jgi:hypothetical protein
MLREEKADKNLAVVNRQRYQFVFNDLPYNIDVYRNLYGEPLTHILRVANADNLEPSALIPEFIKVQKHVKSDPKYSLKAIAKAYVSAE